jgi:hypothetical protein
MAITATVKVAHIEAVAAAAPQQRELLIRELGEDPLKVTDDERQNYLLRSSTATVWHNFIGKS